MTRRILALAALLITAADAQNNDLIKAAERGDLAVVRQLLAAGADVNVHDPGGLTALWIAASGNQAEMVKVLLAAKPDLNAADGLGRTPLMAVVNFRQNLEALRLLLEAWANPNAMGKNGSTPLMLAASEDSPISLAFVHALLAARARVDEGLRVCRGSGPGAARLMGRYTAAGGGTALALASAGGSTEIVQTLLAAGANPDLKQCDGKTPLTIAAANGRADVVRLLLAAEADVNISQADGKTALTSAVENGHADVAELLRSAQ
jgi:ankyrin repeat protein